jgi:hypothetical protein
MLKNGGWQIFLVGVLCGAIFMAIAGAGWVWWKPADPSWDDLTNVPTAKRSSEDENLYDACLASGRNTVACDALMRMVDRGRIADAAIKTEIAKMLAAGANQCDVIKWAYERTFNGSKLSDALGIPLTELYATKC